jgi:hypothetical protein
MEQAAPFNKFAIPVRMGLIISLVKVIITTIGYQFFAGSWLMSTLFMLVGLGVVIGMLIQTGKMQRKAVGGYIDIKQAFQAIFIAGLIVCVLTGIYELIYVKFINPEMMEKVKEATIASMEKWGAPQESIDKTAQQFDESQKLNIGKQLLGWLTSIIFYGILSLICAAVVKKNKPAHLA